MSVHNIAPIIPSQSDSSSTLSSTWRLFLSLTLSKTVVTNVVDTVSNVKVMAASVDQVKECFVVAHVVIYGYSCPCFLLLLFSGFHASSFLFGQKTKTTLSFLSPANFVEMHCTVVGPPKMVSVHLPMFCTLIRMLFNVTCIGNLGMPYYLGGVVASIHTCLAWYICVAAAETMADNSVQA